MDFSITSLFVVPVGNTLPSSGSIENLNMGQVGIFKDKAYTVATAANVASANYIQICQGRPGTGLGTKRSDRIKTAKVTRYEKFVAQPTAANEIWDISNISAMEGDSVSFSVRIHGTFPDLLSHNGLVQNLTVPMPAPADPSAPAVVANETIIDLLMAKLRDTLSGQDKAGNALRMDSFLTYYKEGAGASAKIRIESKPVQRLPFVSADLNTRNIDKERIWFRPFIYKGADTTADAQLFDSIATVDLVQRSSFVSGTSEEVKQMEVDYYSYQATHKHLFRNSGYNQQFESYVVDGTNYDIFYIQFDELNPDSEAFAATRKIDETVCLAIPSGASTNIEAILTAYLGAPVSGSGDVVTTTTSSTTSSTTTSTTTLRIP